MGKVRKNRFVGDDKEGQAWAKAFGSAQPPIQTPQVPVIPTPAPPGPIPAGSGLTQEQWEALQRGEEIDLGVAHGSKFMPAKKVGEEDAT